MKEPFIDCITMQDGSCLAELLIPKACDDFPTNYEGNAAPREGARHG